MQIYLPIAEMSESVVLLLGMGLGIGFLSGLFGVGGGFLTTPLLIFIGVSPAVAVASSANQIVATSVAGVLAHWRRGTIDLRMGAVLLVGGVIGSIIGVGVFTFLRSVGQIDLVINLVYVVFLGTVGSMMFAESIRAIWRVRRTGGYRRKLHKHTWLHGLPLKMRFPRSRLYISALAPMGLGAFVGFLAALIGVGGGFVMVPAMIYLLGMPTAVVAGTSLFQIIFVAASVTLFHASVTQAVDLVLALLLLLGSVLGVQLGARFGVRLAGEQFRMLLAILVLAVAMKMMFDLAAPPPDLYTISVPR